LFVDQKDDTLCTRLLNLLKIPLTTEKEVDAMENESTEGAVNEEFEVVDEESNSQDITEKNEGNDYLIMIENTLEACCHQVLLKIVKTTKRFSNG
jgi:hypothetical protein